MRTIETKSFRRACLTLVFLGSFVTQTALAYDRFVVVNGQRLTPIELAYLENAAGEYVPDGRYWLNFATGTWGYEGGPMQGVIGGAAQQNNGYGQSQSYDEVRDDFCVRNPGICP